MSDATLPAAAAAPAPGSLPASGLAHFPIAFFPATMGLAGLALAWLRAAAVLDVPRVLGELLSWLALAAFAAVAGAYLAKAARYPAAVRGDFRHPIRIAFLPTPGIALVLLAAAIHEHAHGVAAVLWWGGVVLQSVLTVTVLSTWMAHPLFTTDHITPAWFIPPVGLVAVPLAGVEFASDGINWAFLGTGTIFWLAIMPLVLGRLFVHHNPPPPKLLPTLAVLVAPPAVILLSTLRLLPAAAHTGFPQAAYGVTAFFAILVLAQLPRLVRIPFAMSWWAYSFPVAALTSATLVVAGLYGGALEALAWTLLGAASAVIAALTAHTTHELLAGRICVPD